MKSNFCSCKFSMYVIWQIYVCDFHTINLITFVIWNMNRKNFDSLTIAHTRPRSIFDIITLGHTNSKNHILCHAIEITMKYTLKLYIFVWVILYLVLQSRRLDFYENWVKYSSHFFWGKLLTENRVRLNNYRKETEQKSIPTYF